MTSRVVPIPEELEDESTPSFSSFCNTLSSMLFTCSSNPSDYFPCCKIHSNSANAGEPLTVAEPVYTEKGGSDEKREINAPTFMPKTAPPPSKATIKCFSERDSDVIAGSHIVTVPQNHNNLEEIAKDTQGGTSHGIRPTVSLQQIALTKEQNDNIQVGLLRRNTDFSHVYSNYRYSTPMLQYPTPTNHETTTICDPNTIPFFFQQQNINNTINVCSEPIASIYKVRGPTYFQNGIKVPSQESLFALVQVESYVVNPTKQHPSKINDVMKSNSNNFLNQWKHLNPHPPFLLIVNWILPWGNLKSYFCQMITTYDGNTKLNSAHQLWNRFATQMTNEERSDRLKLIPHIVNGPWIIKKMVGASPNKPVILGKNDPDFVTYNASKTTEVKAGEKILEICIHVTEKAPTIANACKNASDSLTVDLALVIEAKTSMELPEQVLCAVRLHRISMNSGSISCCKSC